MTTSLLMGAALCAGLFAVLSGLFVAYHLLRQRRIVDLNRKGVRYQEWQMWDDAARCFEQALDIDRTHALSHYNLGFVLYHGKHLVDQAATELSAALSAEPDMAAAHYALGHLLFHKTGVVEQAKQHLQEALALQPQLCEAYNTLGLMEIKHDNWTDALSMFTKAVRINETYATAWCNLAISCIYLGRSSEAIDAAQRYAELQPESPMALRNLGNIYGACGRREAAIEQLERARALDATDWIVHFWLGCLHLQTDAPRTAIPCFHEALRLNQGAALVHYNLALCYEAVGNKRLARTYIDQAVELNPQLGDGLIREE